MLGIARQILSARDYGVFVDHYGIGSEGERRTDYREMAKRHDISRSTVGNILRRAHKLIQEEVAKSGYKN